MSDTNTNTGSLVTDAEMEKIIEKLLKTCRREKIQEKLRFKHGYLAFCDFCPNMAVLGMELWLDEFHLLDVCVECKEYFENESQDMKKLHSHCHKKIRNHIISQISESFSDS